jgi:hypothetical protein
MIDLLERFVSNKAKFHKKCRNKYDKQLYDKASKKRKLSSESVSDTVLPPSTRARYTAQNIQPKCFFCDKEDSTENLTKAQTFELDRKVRNAANHLCDEMFLAKLSEGDMIAVEALYHKSCLSALYNRLRDLQTTKSRL